MKPIVVEQGFHLLWKDVAQGSAKRLLRLLTSRMEPPVRAGVVLDLGHRIVVLLFSNHELASIGRHVLLRFRVADFKEISWRGIACFKEKTSLRTQMFPNTS